MSDGRTATPDASMRAGLSRILREAERAEIDIQKLESKSTSLLLNYSLETTLQSNYQTVKKTICLVITGEPVDLDFIRDRDEINALAGTVANALWSRLNAALAIICNDDGATFPTDFAERPSEVARFEREIARFPESIGNIIREFDPYKGTKGDSLFVLSKVALRQDNQIIEVAPVMVPNMIERAERAGIQIINRWQPSNKSLILGSAAKDLEMDKYFEGIPLRILFDGIQIRNGKTVTEVLTEARELIVRFIEALKAVAVE